jgi:hypothetical protein
MLILSIECSYAMLRNGILPEPYSQFNPVFVKVSLAERLSDPSYWVVPCHVRNMGCYLVLATYCAKHILIPRASKALVTFSNSEDLPES